MLQTALSFVRQRLDQVLQTAFAHEDSVTVLNHLVEANGAAPQKNQNKIVLTLINLEYETNKAYYQDHYRVSSSQSAKVQPPQMFNIVLLCTSCFNDYEEALKHLNATIAFFQATPSFTRQTTPGLPPGVEALHFDIENMSFEETHNLWSAMGAKYQPSIIYKVRHIQIDQRQLESLKPTVADAGVQALPGLPGPDEGES